MSPHAQVRFAWVLLVLSIIGWPITALTIAKSEPQVVLGLSWFAIVVGAVSTLLTAEVKEKQEGDNE